MKIKIPKDVIGVALSVESFSHFPEEQEIIFPPGSKFKLIKRNSEIKYYSKNSNSIIKRYEFICVGSSAISFKNRLPYRDKLKAIDFAEMIELNNETRYTTIINTFISKYIDKMDICKVKIGNKIFFVFIDRYDSSGAYKDFYAIKTENGFALYSFYKGYLLFNIEIGIVNDEIQLHVNYYTKYNRLRRNKIINDYDFINFLANVGNYFHAQHIIIYTDYTACRSYSNKNISVISKKTKIQRNPSNINLQYDIEAEINLLSGNYCVDFYNYFKYNIKRYNLTGVKIIPGVNIQLESQIEISKIDKVELTTSYSYDMLDKLKNTSPKIILSKNDMDEIYQLYVKNYLIEKREDTIASFYIWLIENKCYLIDIFTKKMRKIFSDKDNPFMNDYYIFNGNYYLYNRNRLLIYPEKNYMNI